MADKDDVIKLLQQNVAPDVPRAEFSAVELNKKVFRVKRGNSSWILKKTEEGTKELLVHRLFSSYKVSQFDQWVLNENWICMTDLGLPILGEVLNSVGFTRESSGFFYDIGRVATSAFVAGMRDRNLGNVLYDVHLKRCYHVDYTSGLEERLSDRLFRPHRLLAYLIGRLYLDILSGIKEHKADFPPHSFETFYSGIRDEAKRMADCTIPLHISGKIVWKPYILRTHSLLGKIDSLWPKAVRLASRKYLERLPEHWRPQVFIG